MFLKLSVVYYSTLNIVVALNNCFQRKFSYKNITNRLQILNFYVILIYYVELNVFVIQIYYEEFNILSVKFTILNLKFYVGLLLFKFTILLSLAHPKISNANSIVVFSLEFQSFVFFWSLNFGAINTKIS